MTFEEVKKLLSSYKRNILVDVDPNGTLFVDISWSATLSTESKGEKAYLYSSNNGKDVSLHIFAPKGSKHIYENFQPTHKQLEELIRCSAGDSYFFADPKITLR